MIVFLCALSSLLAVVAVCALITVAKRNDTIARLKKDLYTLQLQARIDENRVRSRLRDRTNHKVRTGQ